MASLDLLILPKLEILELHHMHGIFGVAILVDQQIDKKNLILPNSIASKIPQKIEKNNLKSLRFSEVRNSTKHTFTYSAHMQDF